MHTIFSPTSQALRHGVLAVIAALLFSPSVRAADQWTDISSSLLEL